MNFGSGLLISTHRGVTLGGPWLDPNASFTVQALGGLSARDWLHGIVPWWNPYTGVGVPLAGEMQTISLFLPFVLLLHFTNGLIFLKIVLQIIAGLATYALVRQLGMSRLAAFGAAAIFEFNGPFAWFAHAPIMPIPFLPVLLLGIEKAFAAAEARRRGGWILIGAALAYSLYAGFPETAFLNGLLASLWTLYRIVVARSEARMAFIGKIALGLVGGVLLSAPIVLPFLEYQNLSDISHAFPIEGLSRVSLPALLFPYIYGPISAFGDADPTGQLGSFWGGNGGYLDFTVLFLAIWGAFTGRRSLGLRVLLLLWMAVFLAKVTNILYVGYLLSFIPGMNVVAVNRYGEASWAMAAAILSAYGLNDWVLGKAKRAAPTAIAGVLSLFLAAAGIRLGAGVMRSLLHGVRHYPFWLWGSLFWASAVSACIVLLYFQRPGRYAIRLMGLILAVNAVTLYAIPTLAGVRRPEYDFGLIHFLQKHLGDRRFYTLGPFAPNYGGYFGVASINHNAIPIPRDWVCYVRSNLDPGWSAISSSLFIGYGPAPFEDREKAISTHLIDFERTAVKYILASSSPFVHSVLVSGKSGNSAPLLLKEGQPFSGVLPSAISESGWIQSFGVVIGMYGQAVSGEMRVILCSGNVCSSGSGSLVRAQDRGVFEIPLNAPLQIVPSQEISYELTYVQDNENIRSDSYVFLWLWPGNVKGAEPQITLRYSLLQAVPKCVYHGQVGNLYELPHPAAYFDVVGGDCRIWPADRKNASVSCSGPSVLIRRELYYPGWRALVNGRLVMIKRSGSIFQSVDLPPGRSVVAFSYRPTHAFWLYALGVLGVLCLAFSLFDIRRAVGLGQRT